MKKSYTIIKVGYTSGIYGCSGEFFNCIYTTREGLRSFKFSGMYGADERVGEAMKKRGFLNTHNSSEYGKMTRKEAHYFWSENQAIDYIKSNFKSI